jgi:hypothetical protein
MKETRTIEEWITVLKIQLEDDSPFQGLVDIRPILDLPLSTQNKIFDALPPHLREKVKLKVLNVGMICLKPTMIRHFYIESPTKEPHLKIRNTTKEIYSQMPII